ncbi:MATE family efflux transporter [Mediterraneibacter sp. NSJ-151]|uniref:MATE family efflux transporter n=1 Tax=Mediterraneibacter sp. NSJ-151 TaxID=2897708 RepID=UPI001F0AD1FC|nr:MATE family efflux transporter [Mediterraneibacter sp. NSJ-151]MCH4279945.1 MATE family efflux transporter [Mediterraneibacter sp. NSJ-151]
MSQEMKTAPAAENKMGTMPIGKLLFNMSLPMMISMLVQALYNIVDSIFVSKLSENALTAVSLAFPLQMLLIAVATGTGVGMNALLSKALGERRSDEVNRIASNAAFLYFVSYVVICILGFTIVKPFYMSQMGHADVEIMEMGIDYLSTVMIFSFGLLSQIYFERLLTSTGKTIFSMTSQLCGAITNIILDPILIFGLCGLPKMGVTGAAVATVIGQCVAAVVAFTCNHKYNHEVKLIFHGFRPNGRIIRTIYAIGIPSIIMQSIGSVMTYSMNRILIEFSSTATAVFGVYFKLQSFFFMPVFGLNNGITPIIAFNYGAQNRKRMVKTIKLSMITAFCLTFIGFLCFEFIPQALLGMFSASADMLKIGVPALRIIGIHYLIAWFCIICGTVFQALGKAVFSMIVSIMRQLIILVPAAYILSKLGGLHAVWWSFPIAEIVSLTVSLFFLFRIYRTIISTIPDGSDIL